MPLDNGLVHERVPYHPPIKVTGLENLEEPNILVDASRSPGPVFSGGGFNNPHMRITADGGIIHD